MMGECTVRVGSRVKKRKREISYKKKIIILGGSVFILMSSTGIITLNTVSTILNNIGKDNNVIEEDNNNNIESINYEDIILSDINKVRADIHNKWYGGTISDGLKNPKDSVMLVNKSNRVSEDYIPEDLVIPNIKFLEGTSNKYIVSEVADALEDMFKAAKKDNVTLIGVSGYRSYDYQDNLYKNKVKTKGKKYADKYVAVAGASEHQLGLAIDLVSSDYTSIDNGFANSKGFKWLDEHMQDYGFILRYLKGKEEITGYAFEPWHIRYVGVDVAKEIKNRGITLEEYLDDVK